MIENNPLRKRKYIKNKLTKRKGNVTEDETYYSSLASYGKLSWFDLISPFRTYRQISVV